MELPSIPKKKSKLTLYIIIALFLGIAVGFYINKNYLVEENARLVVLEKSLIEIKTTQKQTTDSTLLHELESKRKIDNQKILPPMADPEHQQ